MAILSQGYPVAFMMLGFMFLTLSVVHILYCTFYWYVCLEAVNGAYLFTLGLVICIKRRYPSFSMVIALMFGSLLATTVFVINVLNLICLYRSSTFACVTTIIRTEFIQQKCSHTFQDIQRKTEKSFLPRKHFLALLCSVTIGFGLIQLILLTVSVHKLKSWMEPWCNKHGIQLVIGLGILTAGCLHFGYCGLYFYTGMGIWTAAIIITTGIYGLCSDDPKRGLLIFLYILSVLSALALLGFNGFGIFCWVSQKLKYDDIYSQHCEASPYVNRSHRLYYENCYHGLFNAAYKDWRPIYAQTEISHVRLGSYCTLILLGLIEIVYGLCKIVDIGNKK